MTWSSALLLSADQLELLLGHGEERSAQEGEVLFRVGDPTYPFIALLEGEVAVSDPAGGEIVRHGPREFLGEVSLLSGQTVFLTAQATRPTRYLVVDREALRPAVRGRHVERPCAHRLHRPARGAAGPLGSGR